MKILIKDNTMLKLTWTGIGWLDLYSGYLYEEEEVEEMEREIENEQNA